MNKTIEQIHDRIGYDDCDYLNSLTDEQAEKLLDWIEKSNFNGELNEDWDKLNKFLDSILILSLEDIKALDYNNGLKLLKQLDILKESEWAQTDLCVENNPINLNCDYIIDEYYQDKNEVYSETVSWVSYWKDVPDDMPKEVLKEKAHWEILE